MTTANELREKISDWLNDRNNNEYDLVYFLIDECGVVLKPEEEERTEFEVEYGYMIDEETHGKSFSEGYDNEKDAKEYYDMLVSNKEYDYVWLVMRHMEGEDCMCSETIEEWKQDEEEEEPYCFKDTTIDTVENDICFCSVGGCVKPTEFDYNS